MKKFVWLVIAFIYCVPVYAATTLPAKPTSDSYVYDYADVISADVEANLNKLSLELDGATSAQVFVMTIDTIGNYSAAEFGTKMIREWGMGQAELNNGMFIFATTDQGAGQNDVWISVGQGLEGRFPDGKLGRLIDEYMIPHLIYGDYSSAFENIYRAVYNDIGEEYNWSNPNVSPSTPQSYDEISPGTIIIGVVIFLVLVTLFSNGNNNGGGPGGPTYRRTTPQSRGFGGTGSFGGGFGGGRSGGFRGGGGSSGGGGAGRRFIWLY